MLLKGSLGTLVPHYEKLHWTFASPKKISLWSGKEKAYSPSKLRTVVHFPYLNEFVGEEVRTIRCLSLQCTICSGLAPGSPLWRCCVVERYGVVPKFGTGPFRIPHHSPFVAKQFYGSGGTGLRVNYLPVLKQILFDSTSIDIWHCENMHFHLGQAFLVKLAYMKPPYNILL